MGSGVQQDQSAVRNLCPLRKVLTNKPFNRDAFKNTMISVWKRSKPVCIEVGDNIFVFQFKHIVDRRKVLMLGPWSFDKAVVLMGFLNLLKYVLERYLSGSRSIIFHF